MQLVSVPTPTPSYKVGSTLTMSLPMQGGCNFIVGHLLFYCELLPISFCFVSGFYNLPSHGEGGLQTFQGMLASQSIKVFRELEQKIQ